MGKPHPISPYLDFRATPDKQVIINPYIFASGGGGGMSNFNDIPTCIKQCLALQLTGYSISDPVMSVPDTSTGGGLDMSVQYGAPTYQIVGGKPVVHLTTGDDLKTTHAFTGDLTIIVRGAMAALPGGRIFEANYMAGSNCLLGWWSDAMDQCFFDDVVKLDGNPHPQDTSTRTYAARFTSTACDFWGSSGSIASTGAKNRPNGWGINTVENSDCYFIGSVIYSSALSDPDLTAAIALMDTL